ncbi:allantoate amidohydrolase [Nitrospirillum iridis]|uniref:Allantoate deiminase n=1 Tax=Nitrospirillum iridis TaxID=765888 RepID=A0A7X0AZ67_9PROT|nr:allantoate amidohydrolase [Nitrospirillum iridis]MBB6252803.1 allantoate deiminase [Nitrospirillum iridis]
MSGIFGPALMARLENFARHSADAPALTRLYLTREHRAAADQLLIWMREAGMEAHVDAAGTVVGRYEGLAPNQPALLLGSHIDTVRNAGRYDGNLGVLAAVTAVAELNRRGERLPYAIEVLGFGDEEGVRFPVTLTGSRAVAGTLAPDAMAARDRDGVTLGEALKLFGGDPARLDAVARDPAKVLGFVEVHIEQGPVLESLNLPLGIVTAINGASRYAVTITGQAGHAGTVPMGLRRDALAAAAEMVLAVEARGGAEPDLVATVGRIEAKPGAINVIPGQVTFTIDLRSPSDDSRRQAAADLAETLTAIAGRRGVTLELRQTHDAAAARCHPGLMRQLDQAVARAGLSIHRLPSGAGHDAMALAALCPIAMLFVRCKGGVSHHPAESITGPDADLAVAVLLDFLRRFEPVSPIAPYPAKGPLS